MPDQPRKGKCAFVMMSDVILLQTQNFDIDFIYNILFTYNIDFNFQN